MTLSYQSTVKVVTIEFKPESKLDMAAAKIAAITKPEIPAGNSLTTK